MNKKSVITVIVGTIVAFVWTNISWMGLGWHMNDFKTFKSDIAVMDVIREQAQGSGLYTLPNMDPTIHKTEGGTEKWSAMARKGPFAFISTKVDGIPPGITKLMVIGFFINMLVAAILYGLLCQTKLEKDKQKVLFLAVAAVAGSLIPYLVNWYWWQFPFSAMAINVVDTFITWGIAGTAMVQISKRIK